MVLAGVPGSTPCGGMLLRIAARIGADHHHGQAAGEIVIGPAQRCVGKNYLDGLRPFVIPGVAAERLDRSPAPPICKCCSI